MENQKDNALLFSKKKLNSSKIANFFNSYNQKNSNLSNNNSKILNNKKNNDISFRKLKYGLLSIILFSFIAIIYENIEIKYSSFIDFDSFNINLNTETNYNNKINIDLSLDELNCPKEYKTCTYYPEDIFEYLNSNTDTNYKCVNNTEIKRTLFSYKQGPFLDLGNFTYQNVTKSKSFALHRLYYKNISRPSYMVLMNNKQLCNNEPIIMVDINYQVNSSKLHNFQCDLNKQNKNHTNIIVNYNESYKWYGDNENFIDIITAHNVIIAGSDIYNHCNNEYYTGREVCGNPVSPNKDININRGNIFNNFNPNTHKINTYQYLINVAQSRGYFHFFVESMPRLSPFIYLIKELSLQNKDNDNWKFNIHVSNIETPWNFFQFLFRNEIENGIKAEKYHGYKFTKNLIMPHVSPCLFARKGGSSLLNNILRKQIELYIDEHKININKNEDGKNILLLKRHKRRWIKNFNILKKSIFRNFIKDKKHNLYIHDDRFLNKTHPINYYIEFYKADIVIGAFGAGLVNIVLCKPGTAVIMIQGSHHKQHRMYMHHASALGMRYYGYYTDTKWNINIFDIIKIINLYI